MTKEGFMKKYPEGMTFDVLGTTYTLHYNDTIYDEHDANGLSEYYAKEIIITLKGYEDPEAFKNVGDYYKKVLRHELIHAFFHEMGLSNYARDEILVDALAIKFPQMYKLLKGIF